MPMSTVTHRNNRRLDWFAGCVPANPTSAALGRTGCDVTQFALGGEGVLRTHGRTAEAIAVIHLRSTKG